MSTPTFYKCPYPGCLFVHTKSSRVHDHVREVHQDKRPHKCSECGHAFKRPAHLQAHMVRHTERQLFKCTYMACFFKTYHQAKLHEHMKTHTTPDVYNTFESQVLAYFLPQYTSLSNKLDCTGIHEGYTYVLVDSVFLVNNTIVLLEIDEAAQGPHQVLGWQRSYADASGVQGGTAALPRQPRSMGALQPPRLHNQRTQTEARAGASTSGR